MLTVVEVTASGAVPVARVEVNCPLIPSVVSPEKAPAVETSQLVELTETVFNPPPREMAPVDVPVPTLIAKLDEALRLMAAPETVSPKLLVTKPLEVTPLVAVISPEMVGVAVQAVPETVRFPPREVRFAPETVRVPATSSLLPGLVVLMPTLPFPNTDSLVPPTRD